MARLYFRPFTSRARFCSRNLTGFCFLRKVVKRSTLVMSVPIREPCLIILKVMARELAVMTRTRPNSCSRLLGLVQAANLIKTGMKFGRIVASLWRFKPSLIESIAKKPTRWMQRIVQKIIGNSPCRLVLSSSTLPFVSSSNIGELHLTCGGNSFLASCPRSSSASLFFNPTTRNRACKTPYSRYSC